MSLKRTGYLPRIIDAKIKSYLGIFGALSIEGPKWCGKTWTSLNHANSVTYLMDPSGGYSNKERALINPALALEGEKPHLIDEWQEVPGIWDAVRFSIDMNPGRGKYILTGSVTPPRDSYMHSGAGRFAIVRMRPMSLFESGDSLGIVSFGALLQGELFEPFSADMELERLISITIRGGWPEALNITEQDAEQLSGAYLEVIKKSELFQGGIRKKDAARLNKLLRALARNNSATVNISTLAQDSGMAENYPPTDVHLSRQTTSEYLADLKKIYIIEDIQGWVPEIRSKTRIRMMPKMTFADPSLAIAALGVSKQQLMNDLKTYGFMFENLCLRDLSVYADFYGGRIYHYRDNSYLEVDAIVEMPDGIWGGFEIKLGEHQVENAAATLRRLRDKMVKAGSPPPVCLCVITGGGFGRVRNDGICVLPITALRH